MSPRAKAAAIFIAGMASGLVLLLGAVVVLYFYAVKPMTVRAMENVIAQPPPFPSDVQNAVFEGTWTRKDKSQLDFASLRGKIIVLNVWATWCPPCLAELPSLAKLAAHFAKQDDVRIICVSTEQMAAIWPKMDKPEFSRILYSSNGRALPPTYDTSVIPATFIINKHGQIVFKHVGLANWDNEVTYGFLEKLK